MAEIVRDQAEGLRRLLARNAVRSIAVISGGNAAGQTCCVINLAAVFSQRGRRVLVLDEKCGAGSSAAFLGLRPQWDLWHVMRRKKNLDEVILPGPAGMMLLPAGKAMAALDGASEDERRWLAQSAAELPAEVILVDAAGGGRASGLALASQETVVLVSAEAGAITEAYASIKECARDFAKRRFHILVNRVKSPQQAEALYRNMAGATQRFLNVSLRYLGWLPQDEDLRRATRLRLPLLETYRSAPAAEAFRQVAETIEQWPYPEETCLEDFMQRLMRGSRAAAALSA